MNALDSGIHFFHVHLILVEKLTKFFTYINRQIFTICSLQAGMPHKKYMPKTLACSHRTPRASPPKLHQLRGCLDFGLFVLVHVSVHPHSRQVWHTQANKLIEMGEKKQ